MALASTPDVLHDFTNALERAHLIQGQGASTTVAGERCPMLPGELGLTP